jgi:hypothetical protein
MVRQRRRRMNRGRAAAATLAVVIFAENMALGANTDLLAVAAAFVEILAAIAVLLLVRPEDGFWKEGGPIFALLALLVLIAAAPGIGFARALIPPLAGAHAAWLTPDLYGAGMARLFGAVALFIAAAAIGFRRGAFRILLGWLAALGTIDILVGLAIRQIDPEHVWGLAKRIHVHRFTGTLLNANASGCLFGVTALLGLAFLQTTLREPPETSGSRGQFVRIAASLAALFGGLGACAISGSRTALALTAAAALLLVARDAGRGLSGSRLWMLAGLAGAAALFLWAFSGATVDRLDSSGEAGLERLQIWSHFVDYARQAPAFGYGPLSFSALNTSRLDQPADAIGLWYINSAHNKPLSLMIEHGWLFCAVLAAVLLAMAAAMIRSGRPERRDPLASASFAAVFVIVGCAMTDIALDVPVVAALLIVLWSGLWGRSLRLRADGQRRQAPARAAARSLA